MEAAPNYKTDAPMALNTNIIRTEKGSGNGTRLIFFLMIKH
jgi:hypothetical protein